VPAELAPVASAARERVWRRPPRLAGHAEAVNVPDGAGARAHMGALVAAAILKRNGIEPILQLTCRDRNRIALEADLMGAAAEGIRNLLLLSGDDPTAGDQPETKPVFDIDSTALTAIAKRMRDSSELPTGKPIAGKAAFFLGAADVPLDPAPGWQPTKLAGKAQAGAQFVQTQFCMDAGILARYTARLAENEATRGLALLAGLAPLPSAKSARRMEHHPFGPTLPDPNLERLH